MKILAMKKEYLQDVLDNTKVATTRLKLIPAFEQRELVSKKNRFSAIERSGIVIEVVMVVEWTKSKIKDRKDVQEAILDAEDQKHKHFKTWQDFLDALDKLNGRKIRDDEKLWTHIFKIVGEKNEV